MKLFTAVPVRCFDLSARTAWADRNPPPEGDTGAGRSCQSVKEGYKGFNDCRFLRAAF